MGPVRASVVTVGLRRSLLVATGEVPKMTASGTR